MENIILSSHQWKIALHIPKGLNSIYLLKGNQLKMLRYLGHSVFILTLWVVCCYKNHWGNMAGVNIEFSSSSTKSMQVKTLLPPFCFMTKLGYSPWKYSFKHYSVLWTVSSLSKKKKKKKITLKTFLTSSLTHFEVTLPESSLSRFQMKCHDPSSVVTLPWSSQAGHKLNCVPGGLKAYR